MTAIDWAAPAKLMERCDGGSDLYYEFTDLRSAPLGLLVAEVVAMPAPERARLVIDAGAAGMLNIGDILTLSARDDFPGVAAK